jgi:pyridoxal phosphate enzyme (YggS family)
MTTCPASFASDELVQRVAANLAEARRRVTATGRVLESVRLVAVTKTFPSSVVRAAAAVGLNTVGENYVDELEEKSRATQDLALRWHYLGALQTNKIARIVAASDVVCGVSRQKELERIAAHRPGMAIYVEVDHTGETQRNGAAPREVEALVRRGRELELDVRGLMTVAPTDPDAAWRAFTATTALADDLGLLERSMGMSDDLEAALECGSTEIRLGRALFGPREAR